MDLEYDLLDMKEYIEGFIDNMEEIVDEDNDNEFAFLEDHSDISHTELDHYLHQLHRLLDLTNKLLAK